MNKATEVMMQYVENLKRTYEKDHAELMEIKKLANQKPVSVPTGKTVLNDIFFSTNRIPKIMV